MPILVERVSVNPATDPDAQAAQASQSASISGDGRFVAFDIFGASLVAGGHPDRNALLYDRTADSLVQINNGPTNLGFAPSISADANFVAFGGSTSGVRDISVYNRLTALRDEKVFSPDPGGGGHSDNASVSGDGSFVAFQSAGETFELRLGDATTGTPMLVDGALPTFVADGTSEIYVLNRATNTLELVSRASSVGATLGAEANASSAAPSVSGDGNLVAFHSLASNLADSDGNGSVDAGNTFEDIFVYNRAADTIQRINDLGIHTALFPAISADGRFVAFQGAADTTAGPVAAGVHIYLYELSTNTLTLVDQNSAGEAGLISNVTAPSISEDGRYVVFGSTATNLVDRDGDGAFTDDDTNNQADIFVFDRLAGDAPKLQLLTFAPDGQQASGGPSQFPAISANGQAVAFESGANNLVPDDTNNLSDVFVTFNNAQPILDLDDSVAGTGFATAFTEGGAAVTVADTDVSITDADDTQLTGATIILANRKPDDSLTVNTAGLPAGISASVDTTDPDRILVSLTGAATLDAYELALQQVFFSNSSQDPDTTLRDVTVVVIDEHGISNTARAAITVVPVDTPLGIQIVKVTNGADNNQAPGPTVFVGDTVTFTYTVTNTSDVPLENVVVTDDNGTAGNAGDNFSPDFVGGDTDGDGDLDVGESWTYQATRIATAGQHTNVATVTAVLGGEGPPVTDSDVDNHFGITPGGEGCQQFYIGTDDSEVLPGDECDNIILGFAGNDVLLGLEGNDRIRAGTGSDRLLGNEGRDILTGEAGNDRLDGNEGNDTGFGGAGNDLATGGAGDDRLFGDAGDDRLDGGDGNDRLDGGEGTDHLEGEAGNDILVGGNGNDRLEGQAGNDALLGGAGNDRLHGGTDSDALDGGTGNDIMLGQDGIDVLHGRAGNDRLLGGRGADLVFGGDGADRFELRFINESGPAVAAADRFRDFDFREGDRIRLANIDADQTVAGNDAFVFIGSAAFSDAGQVRFQVVGGETRVLLNTDNDAAAEAMIRVDGVHAMTSSWFLL
jgi:Ca2+-binding RTX toxin-like protein